MLAPLVLLIWKRFMSASEVATILVYLNTLPPGAGGETEFNQANVQVPMVRNAGILWIKSWKMWKLFPRSCCFVFDFKELSFKELKFIKMVSCHSLSVSIVASFRRFDRRGFHGISLKKKVTTEAHRSPEFYPWCNVKWQSEQRRFLQKIAKVVQVLFLFESPELSFPDLFQLGQSQLGEACGWYCGNLAQCFLTAMNSMKGLLKGV